MNDSSSIFPVTGTDFPLDRFRYARLLSIGLLPPDTVTLLFAPVPHDDPTPSDTSATTGKASAAHPHRSSNFSSADLLSLRLEGVRGPDAVRAALESLEPVGCDCHFGQVERIEIRRSAAAGSGLRAAESHDSAVGSGDVAAGSGDPADDAQPVAGGRVTLQGIHPGEPFPCDATSRSCDANHTSPITFLLALDSITPLTFFCDRVAMDPSSGFSSLPERGMPSHLSNTSDRSEPSGQWDRSDQSDKLDQSDQSDMVDPVDKWGRSDNLAPPACAIPADPSSPAGAEAFLASLLKEDAVQVGPRRYRVLSVRDLIDFATRQPKGAEAPYWAIVWEASVALGQWLLERGDWVKGKRMLELGCGLGLSGLVAAELEADVVQTDKVPLALRVARQNFLLNGLLPPGQFLADWQDWTHDDQYDIVFGSDLVYEPGVIPSLAPVFRRNLRPGGAILLSAPLHRDPALALIDCLFAGGWDFDTDSRVIHLDRRETEIALWLGRLRKE